MAKSRYYSVTKGFNAEVMVAKAVAYTTDADYKTFVANAVEGEIGVFDATTLALVAAAAPLTEGQKYFVAERRDAEILKFTTTEYRKAQTKKTVYTAPVKQVSTINFAGYVPVAGDEVSVQFIDTAPGNEPFPRLTYDLIVKPAETLAQVIQRLADRINNINDPVNQDERGFVVGTVTATTLIATAKYFGAGFRVALPGRAYEVATVTQTTDFKLGSGFYDHVRSVEREGNIFDGVTTFYPGDGMRSEDFGEPTRFADPTLTYDVYQFTPVRNEKSPTPVNQHHHYMNQLLIIPTAGGGPTAAITTIFGF